jgi:AIG1 family
VKSFQRSCLRGKLGLVVSGTQGGGKSATIDMLMGRQFMEPSHAIRYMPEDTFFEEDEQHIIQDFRRAAVRHWPHHMFERGTPTSSVETCKMYVKIAGVSVQVVELPSMEMHVEREEINGLVMRSETGRFEDVVRNVLDDTIDLVLLVERLDDFPQQRVAKMCRKLQRLYGDTVWSRTVAVLTHGRSLPPAGTHYDDLVAERVDQIQALVQRASGDSAAAVPVVVVENSASCPRDSSTGRPTLPNDTDFQLRLVEALERVLAAHHRVDSLKAVGMRKWWLRYAGAVIVCWLISRL